MQPSPMDQGDFQKLGGMEPEKGTEEKEKDKHISPWNLQQDPLNGPLNLSI